jgi:hypothetical protein
MEGENLINMTSMGNFLSKFSPQESEEALSSLTMLSASAPTALGMFLERFTTLTESYFFYGGTEELRYDTEAHAYFRVDPELGNLTELHGVTTVLRIIDKSNALVPWASKKCAEKILRTIPLTSDSLMLAPISLADFTKLVMEAKNAHKEILEDAGDVGHAAHKCLEVSIQHAIDHTHGVVLELREVPTEEKAKACAEAGFAWMQRHRVRWIKTEQKVYSKEYGYAGTMDGKALVDSCDDPACCSEQFKDSLSIIDWKSSNDLHPEYILQAAGAYHHAEYEEYGEDFQNCFILRLGKNEEEAGKFAPWRIPAKDFPRAFKGFLLCLQLVELIDEVKAWISTQAKGVREIKKQQRAEQKEIAKAKAKLDKAAAKAQLKLERAAEKERIKDDAKKAREEAKLAKSTNLQTPSTSPLHSERAVQRVAEGLGNGHGEAGAKSSAESSTVASDLTTEATEDTQASQSVSVCEDVRAVAAPTGGFLEEESVVEHKPFVIPEEL